MKRLVSICLTVVVLLMSSGYTLANSFSTNDSKENSSGSIGTHLIEFKKGLSQEFRETYKVGFSDETRPDTDFLFQRSSQFLVGIPARQYASYLRAHLSRTPSRHLFIDFGALII